MVRGDAGGFGSAAFAVGVEAEAFLVIGDEAEQAAGDGDILERHCGLDLVTEIIVEHQRREQREAGEREGREAGEDAERDGDAGDQLEQRGGEGKRAGEPCAFHIGGGAGDIAELLRAGENEDQRQHQAADDGEQSREHHPIPFP